MSDKVLDKSLQSARLNIMASIVFKFISIVVNGLILRHVTKEVLGINVRVSLLLDTVLFLGREAFRKSCMSRPSDGDWRKTLNLIWLSLPIGAALSVMLGCIWIYILEAPESYTNQYYSSVVMACLQSCVLLLSEPFFVVGQVYLHVTFRSAVDLFYNMFGVFVQYIVVLAYPEHYILYFAYAALANSTLYLLFNLIYFYRTLWKEKELRKKNDDDDENAEFFIPFGSLADFLPNFSVGFDQERFKVSKSFFKQGFFKQILTDGEKYMFTWFNLMTLSDQGVFDVIANLGSIPARLFFSKYEDSSHLYFSQTVTRGQPQYPFTDQELAASQHLHQTLKRFILLGVVVCTFGFSYSFCLLHIYGGALLSDGIGPSLLEFQCMYVLFLAINGITECYSFAAMTGEQISQYNYKMASMTFIFIACTWIFARLFGPIGFIIANCCNFGMRIAHNVHVISRRHQKAQYKPLKDIWPSKTTILALILAGVCCKLSEMMMMPYSMILHIVIGGVCFLIIMATIYMKELWVTEIVNKFPGWVLNKTRSN